MMEYCCLNGKPFSRFNFIQYGRHTLSYVLVQVTINVPLIRVKPLQAINRPQMETQTHTRTHVYVNAASQPSPVKIIV